MSSSPVHLRPPFRAEHIGSLLRPAALFQKRELLEEGQYTPQDLKAVEDDAIKHVVKLQQELGIKTITDGELRRWIVIKFLFRHRITENDFLAGVYSLREFLIP
jgi:methionine synthase II (cobalamin-independent)